MKDRIHFLQILSLLIAGAFLISVIAPVSASAGADRQTRLRSILAAKEAAETIGGHEFVGYALEIPESACPGKGTVSPSRPDRDALIGEIRSGPGIPTTLLPGSGSSRLLSDPAPLLNRSAMIDELVRNHPIGLRFSDQHLGSYPGFAQKLNETASIRNRSAIIDGLVLNKKGIETRPSRFFSGWGTVRFIDLEGGFYGIVTSSGERFIPDNLPRALLDDGITIRFSGMIGNEEPGIAMWGRTIHLISSEKIDRSFSKEGTIQYIDLEGGFYGISTVNGEKYLPMNLAPEFRVDGLPVAFTARERQDISTTAMWGIPVEITSIRMIGQQQSPIPGSWTLISFSDGSAWHTLLPGTEITASFSDGGKLSGSAGCNRYFAAYETTGVSLVIGRIGSTEMYCEGMMNQEMTYLRLLATAWSFRVEEGALSISDQSGQEILRYHAANAETREKGVKRIEFSRTGGYAGCSDHLVLYENGSARVTRKEYTTVVQVTDDTRNCLDSLLAKVDFSTLRDEYSAPPGGADLFSYTVTYEGRIVHLEETAVPEDLLPVIDLFCDIIVTSAPDDIAPPLHP